MIKIILCDETLIPPFNEPARNLRVLNKPLWLYQRDVLSPYCHQEIEIRKEIEHPLEIPDKAGQEIPLNEELLVYRDNLFFDAHLLAAFLERWIPCFEADGRSYLTVAVGCTGGQHRSVYMIEALADHLRRLGRNVLTRHRELS